MLRLSLGLVPPEEIRIGEVLSFWERLSEVSPHGVFAVYRSPNRSLRAWVQETPPAIAILYDVATGHVYQADPAALYPLKQKLEEWP